MINRWTTKDYRNLLKRVVLLAACIALPVIAWAQWTTSSNDIYNSNSGNVAIGTASWTSYGARLAVHYNSAGDQVMTLRNTNSAGLSSIRLEDNSGSYVGDIGYYNLSGYQGIRIGGNGSVNAYFPSGNVGIGTSNPSARMTVKQLNDSQAGGNAALRIENSAGTSITQLLTGSDNASYLFNSTGSNYLMLNSSGNVGIGTTSPSSKLDVAGDITVSGNISAKYQDLAEWVPASRDLAPGTVVIQDPDAVNSVISSNESYDTRVAGVVSSSPGIILGVAGEGKVRVATTGRVKVRVDATYGPIRAGDLLVTSSREGTAMRSDPIDVSGVKIHRPGTLIGKALESLSDGQSEILVLLSLQ